MLTAKFETKEKLTIKEKITRLSVCGLEYNKQKIAEHLKSINGEFFELKNDYVIKIISMSLFDLINVLPKNISDKIDNDIGEALSRCELFIKETMIMLPKIKNLLEVLKDIDGCDRSNLLTIDIKTDTLHKVAEELTILSKKFGFGHNPTLVKLSEEIRKLLGYE